MSDTVSVAIALGSNLGDRRENIDYALSALSLDVAEMKVSAIVDTAPVGVGEEHKPYLNAVVVGLTRLPSRDLLERLLEIEDERGRLRPYPMAPRTLDLDLILYGNSVVEDPGLSVPHPRFRERVFVLAPLAEVAPEMIDPVTGRSIAQLLSALFVAKSDDRI